MERPVGFADPDVAGVGALGNGGEGELRGELCREVFEGVNGEVDAALFEGFLNLFDEDAFAVEIGGRDEAGLLHAVAGGADDLELDVVAGVAEGVEDVVGLPEGELRASAADADGVAGVVVFAAHSLNRIRDRREDGSHRLYLRLDDRSAVEAFAGSEAERGVTVYKQTSVSGSTILPSGK